MPSLSPDRRSAQEASGTAQLAARFAADLNPLETDMLKWALIFLVIALIAGALGFTGVAGAAMGIAKFLFFIFLVLFVLFLVLGFSIFKKVT
jgi:uncharacterized membrane protein YtjA (UPF0391 family)